MENAYRQDFEFYSGEQLNLPLDVLRKFYAENAIRLLGIAASTPP